MLRDMPMSKPLRFKPLQHTWRHYLQQFFPCMLCQMGRSSHAGLCSECWQHLPWALHDVYRHELTVQIACYYDYPLNNMILQYKYHHQLRYAYLFSQLLLQLKLPKVQAIVAMPISEQRLAERGFNQALEIAKGVAKALHLPIWQPIQRVNANRQKGLTRRERLENIEQQFQLVQSPNRKRQKYRSVLVIDDVVTTGSSLHALSLALQQAGCEKIYFACVAGARA